MKKLIIGLLSLFVVVSLQAQSASSYYKEANKAWKKVASTENDEAKAELLDKGIIAIGKAVAAVDELEGKDKTKMLLLAGDIYNEQCSADLKYQLLNNSYQSKYPDAAMNAYKAYTMALEVASKKYFKSDAMTGLRSTADHLGNAGLFAYKADEFKRAYANYNAVLDVKSILDKAGKKGVLEEAAQMNDHKYMLGLSALSGGMDAEANRLFAELTESGYEEAGVYNALFKLNMETDLEKAEAYLAAGRKKFPEDNGLMVSELNHYLKTNRFDELVGKLEGAIAADPENVSYYSALGNTYDNLFQKEMEAKNLESANKYFEKALEYYSKALEKDGTYFFAIYNSGVLYVNKANLIIEELKVLENKADYSKAGLRAMEVKKSEVNAEFAKALPYFQRAESMDPNDINTLNALKEIYARNEDFEKSKEFSKRLKTVQDGGKNEKSYHENK